MNTETPRKPNRRDQHLPRYPKRANGKERFESLLDTLAEMLSNRETSDFGLAELGERAGATTASVYHFFPTKEAAIIALAERYLVAYASRVSEAASLPVDDWRDIMENCGQSGLEYNAANPLAMIRSLYSAGVIKPARIQRVKMHTVNPMVNPMYIASR